MVECGPAVHGHVRLALVDLTDASAQPYRHCYGVLSFNGEIWNWRELARGLPLNETYRSDTQVLAAMLVKHGVTETLRRLEGMFAFAWSCGDVHVLARDRFGKIPLHVWRSAASFAWASEMKAFAGQPSAPLPPGSVLDLTTGNVDRWYELPRFGGETDGLMKDLKRGVALRLMADAPLCCLVSGGLDSSLVLAIAKNAKPDVVAYTAKFDGSSPDLIAARRVCKDLGVRLVEVKVPGPTPDLMAQAVKAIELDSKAQVEIAALCIPLARAIAADGFKACLSGEAADELFGGYGNMCIAASSVGDEGWRDIRIKQLAKMARGNFMRCNKAFMAAGVECRLPFMERGLVERVINLGKVDCPPGKKLLKGAALAYGAVPSWVVKRTKDTFQGASGMSTAAAAVLPDPARYYRAEFRSAFGSSVLAA